jgi:hypothetical protein
MLQHFLESQAARLADALTSNKTQVQFELPNQVVTAGENGGPVSTLPVPHLHRQQRLGGVKHYLAKSNLSDELHRRLSELEHSGDRAVAAGAALLRYATARYLVHKLLPDGRAVTYQAQDGEAIPTIPVNGQGKKSAISLASDALVEEADGDISASSETELGELHTPFVEAALRFYLLQWVAFDDRDQLLVNTANEAEACLASMQRYTSILHLAVALAPYMVADREYQRKRYGILGQLVNQGRALARFYTLEIIQTIRQRAAENSLNRGLSITLPYFDDQQLRTAETELVVIPAGRIPFWRGFIVHAVQRKQAQVQQDTRLGPSTRRHLLAELHTLENAFIG